MLNKSPTFPGLCFPETFSNDVFLFLCGFCVAAKVQIRIAEGDQGITVQGMNCQSAAHMIKHRSRSADRWRRVVSVRYVCCKDGGGSTAP